MQRSPLLYFCLVEVVDVIFYWVAHWHVSVRTRPVRLPSQLQSDRTAMSCRQHARLHILMTTTASYTRTLTPSYLCVRQMRGSVIMNVCFRLYKPASSCSQLVSEGRFWLGLDILWGGKKSPVGSHSVNFPQAILQKALRLDESKHRTLFQNTAFTASCFRFTSRAEV